MGLYAKSLDTLEQIVYADYKAENCTTLVHHELVVSKGRLIRFTSQGQSEGNKFK